MQLWVLAFVQFCSFRSNILRGEEGVRAERQFYVDHLACYTLRASNGPFLLSSHTVDCKVI